MCQNGITALKSVLLKLVEFTSNDVKLLCLYYVTANLFQSYHSQQPVKKQRKIKEKGKCPRSVKDDSYFV